MTVLHAPATRTDQLELGDAERARVLALARTLMSIEPALLDDRDWLAEARRLSCRLPTRLVEALRDYRHDPGAAGTLMISGVPVDEDPLPVTPSVQGSVERVATVPASAALLIGLQVGEVVAYRQEKSGALVQNVVPVPGMESTQSNAGADTLQFHVENAFHSNRPDFVGLLCLRSDHAGTAGTLVTSIRHALPHIAPDDRRVLTQPRFLTAPPPSFGAGETTKPHPVLYGASEDPNICLDLNATAAADDEAQAVLERLRAVLSETATSLVLSPGQMAFVDNRIVLHGRTKFTPRFDGRDRWLHRVYVHLDNRRSRADRPGNGAVLR